jgi:hypothetical protein
MTEPTDAQSRWDVANWMRTPVQLAVIDDVRTYLKERVKESEVLHKIAMEEREKRLSHASECECGFGATQFASWSHIFNPSFP